MIDEQLRNGQVLALDRHEEWPAFAPPVDVAPFCRVQRKMNSAPERPKGGDDKREAYG
jgi:hypothetical protein